MGHTHLPDHISLSMVLSDQLVHEPQIACPCILVELQTEHGEPLAGRAVGGIVKQSFHMHTQAG